MHSLRDTSYTKPSKSRSKQSGVSRRSGRMHDPLLWEPGSGKALTRQEAIQMICTRVQHSLQDAIACRLMQLFYIQAEDLTEAGLDYETVCALERGFLLNDWFAA